MQLGTRFFLLTALAGAVIVYGSLYPFDFRIPAGGDGAVIALLRSWKEMPSGRGDTVANVLLYMPLGWFGIMSMPRRTSVALRLLVGPAADQVLRPRDKGKRHRQRARDLDPGRHALDCVVEIV